MKTAVSIPDEIFQEAERLRQESGASRSALYADTSLSWVAPSPSWT